MAADQQQFHRRVAKLVVLRDKVDAPDEFSHRMVQCTMSLEGRIERLNEKESADMIISMCSDEKKRPEIAQGLVCLMLTEREQFNRYASLMSQMGDSWFQALYTLNMVSIEMFHRLQESAKDSFLMIIKEAIKINVPKLESVVINFIRTLNGGGEFGSRLRLMTEFAKIFLENQEWMLSNAKPGSFVFPLIVNTFAHIAADITVPSPAEAQRNLLVEVLCLVVRKRPMDVFQLGRDFVFAIMRISKIKMVNELWVDLLRKPSLFGLKSFEEVMFRSISPNVNNHRLSNEVIKRVMFMIDHIKPSQNSKHYEWFMNTYLKGTESQSMRAEVIRFLLHVFPPNATGQFFDARVQLLYMIISNAQHGPESAWCKAALWFDWFLYDPTCPYFALEPGFAVVRYCMGIQATKANSLLEYLVDTIPVLHPPSAARIHASANQAMKVMADFFAQNNQPPVSNILESVRLEKNVREGIRNVFKDFVRNVAPVQPITIPATGSTSNNNSSNNSNNVGRKRPREELAVAMNNENNEHEKSPSPPTRVRKTISKEELEQEVETNYQMLREDLKPIVFDVKEKFHSEESDDSEKSDSVGKLLQKLLDNFYFQEDQIDEDQLELIGQCLHGLIGRPPDNGKSLVPDQPSEEAYQEVFSHPLYITFRNLCFSFTPASDTTSRTPLVTIIAAMRDRDNYITILLLYFIKCGIGNGNSVMPNNEYIQCYMEVASACDKEVAEMLAEDLETMALEDDKLFSLLLPFIIEKFPQEVGSSPDVLHVLCSHIDSRQLSDLIGTMIREANSLFRKDNICAVVMASTEWPTTAQYTLWQLIHAEGVPMDWLLPIVPKIKSSKHGEASVNLLLTLRRLDREPGMSLLRTIFSRQPTPEDTFSVNALRILIDDPETCQKVAELLSSLIKKLINNNELHMNNNSGQDKKQQGKKPMPKLCLEQLLSHLEIFTQFCLTKEKKIAESLFSKWLVQEAFKTVKSCEKAAFLRPKFSQLFAVVEILAEENPQSSRTLRGNRGGSTSTPSKQAPSKRKDDDDDLPVPSKSKKRNIVVLDSDSD